MPDVVGFANVCLDIRVSVERLPKRLPGWRQSLVDQLQKHPPKDSIWEAGGICNTLFVAARLGLNTTVIGHLGNDPQGDYCKACLTQEGIEHIDGFEIPMGDMRLHPFVENTAWCLVIVDPDQNHLFCGSFDVKPGPVYCVRSDVHFESLKTIRNAKALFLNGYAFQECSGDVLELIFDTAIENGTATFFDPGPYGVEIANGDSEDAASVGRILKQCRGVLATEEEAMALTRTSDVNEAGRKLLENDVTEWVVIKLGPKGSWFFRRGALSRYVPGFRVNVVDTVGCGDSFAATIVYGYLYSNGEPRGVLELANAVGAITATHRGAGRNVAQLSAVKALLQSQRTRPSYNSHTMDFDAALKLLDIKPSSFRDPSLRL